MKLQRSIELARRIYGDIVKRRTRVRVVNQAESSLTSRPKFILSPYRSGTTLLRYCLDSHPELTCPPETDYITNLLDMVSDDNAMSGFAGLGYERDVATASVRKFARSFLDTYAFGRGKSDWIDKSPRYAEHPYELSELFPDARFVILHRHPLDQVNSMTRGGTFYPDAIGTRSEVGKQAFTDAASYWASVSANLLEFADSNPSCVIAITYDQLCDKPEETLRNIIEFLGLKWDPSVLEYHKHQHDLGRESGRIRGTVGFSKADNTWLNLPDDWIAEAWQRVEAPAHQIGFVGPQALRPRS